MDKSRRLFLAHSSSAISVFLGSSFFPGLRAVAQSVEPVSDDHFFVLIRTQGAMDSTLGLDPKIMPVGFDAQDIFLEYHPEDIVMASGLRLGPAASPLKDVASECAVINGIFMNANDVGHEVLNNYISSGDAKAAHGTLPVELAFACGTGPFGLLVGGATNTGKRNILVSSINSVINLTELQDLQALAEVIKPTGNESSFVNAQKAYTEALAVLPKLTQKLSEFKKPDAPAREEEVIAAAFTSGASRQAEFMISLMGNGLDTHTSHEKNHLAAQKEIWTRVAELFSFFKKVPHQGSSLFDHTTFMVITEFSRTPALNSALGKDHNPLTNSILLAGKGVAGGRTIGASNIISRKKTKDGIPMHIAAPFDFSTGKVAVKAQGAAFIKPENVIQTVARIFNNPKKFDVVPQKTLPIPGLAD